VSDTPTLVAALAALRAPFEAHQIGSLPRGGTQLDFVGHAAVTDRLLQVDPEWTWEPYATTEHGAPLVLHDGKRRTLWIRLTVCGVTRPGVGIVVGDKDEVEKELISDGIRNAAMRFGVALDLWHKGGSLNGDGPEVGPSGQETSAEPDWAALGWKDRGDHDATKAAVKGDAGNLSAESKDVLRGWASETGTVRAVMSADDVAEWGRQVSALAAGDRPNPTTKETA